LLTNSLAKGVLRPNRVAARIAKAIGISSGRSLGLRAILLLAYASTLLLKNHHDDIT